MNLPQSHRTLLDRFTRACQADPRVTAAFLGGSYARGEADEYSDLDLYLITTDETQADFAAEREAFLRQLGEPVFAEDFGLAGHVFFILDDGAEGELGIGCESQFTHLHHGPCRVLVDKTGLLNGVVFAGTRAPRSERVEVLRRQIAWFWHDVSHFITALGRGQLWWAYGQLEALRRCCISLARLRADLYDADAGEEAYFKLDQAVPAGALAALGATIGPVEPGALLEAAFALVRFYQDAAAGLAEAHGLAYPAALERVTLARLDKLKQRVTGDA